VFILFAICLSTTALAQGAPKAGNKPPAGSGEAEGADCLQTR
jgi:hypothetical protein